MAETNLDKMLLGELVAGLLQTRDAIKMHESYHPTSKLDEWNKETKNLLEYEKQIYEELNKREKNYMSHHPETTY